MALICGVTLLPTASAAPAAATIDDYSSRKIDELLAVKATAGAGKGELLDAISRQFLGTPYVANMLVGSATQPEQLVVDLRGVDCFTLLDYVEALSRSANREQFLTNLVETRYAGGQVDFLRRKHFFTDWAQVARTAASDITGSLSGAATTVAKRLNAKGDGGTYLPGLPVVDRAITYIPSGAVDQGVIGQLRTGDYIGAYADAPGLDVTHVGIFVMTANGPVFRNASSLAANNQVVDSGFAQYVATVPGIVVMRPQ
ncbi:DUF1460 domain-containing protein [Nocardia sp. 2]|uniref:DUF1460 domain-containing protein n=1 Tax=Nocardia acididurans TaxID=2802282 RepID=A0ABS1M1W6_9NOCA|nr:DUF1460 domain-containing protein [Nocardia acididurans]MBL1074657.1 DUF1460 domain-containing protein [Nocardia acididurans]